MPSAQTTDSLQAPSTALPLQLGNYEIQGLLGEGSMGVVFLGHDAFNKRQVAIKALRRDRANDGQAEIRGQLFLNEARNAGSLRHPNIVQILDAGSDHGRRYLVMEYLEDAKTVRDLCQSDTRIPVHQALELARSCALALHHAHEQGVIHRDIKPANILLGRDGIPKIADFGIAVQQTDSGVDEGDLLGSPAYMSPEQVRGEPLTGRSDLFSLGVMLYELLTGESPFQAESLEAVLERVREHVPPPPSTLRRQLPPSMDALMRRLLAKDPGQRPANGEAVAEELGRVLEGLDDIVPLNDDRRRFELARSLSFFKDFSDQALREIITATRWRNIPRNTVLIREGAVGDAFFILARGHAVIKKGNHTLGILESGECFGEMGYLRNTARTASVVSREEVTVIKINARLVDQLSTETQLLFHKTFLRILMERLERTNELLVRRNQ